MENNDNIFDKVGVHNIFTYLWPLRVKSCVANIMISRKKMHFSFWSLLKHIQVKYMFKAAQGFLPSIRT